MEKLSVEDLEELREKEFAERVERIQNTMSRFRKIAYILMVILNLFLTLFFFAYCLCKYKKTAKKKWKKTTDNG